MQELIHVTTNEQGFKVVSARELYNFLEIKSDFSDWCKRMFDYGFEENIDYHILLKFGEKVSKTNPLNYALTIDTAKEIAMIQRSDKGKQARQYFIECERLLNSSEPRKLTNIEILELAMKAELANVELQKQNHLLQQQNEQLQPKADYADKVLNSESGHATTVIAKELGMRSATELNQLLCGMGIQYLTKSNEWVLTAKYQGKGYVESRTHAYMSKDGFTTKTKIYFVWTELGRKFLHETIKKQFSTFGQIISQ
jgi:anti-repressor protein